MSNIYYHPEEHGLRTVGEIQYGEACYSFDLGVIWTDDTGTFYGAFDSGCSCPSPFENHSRAHLAPLSSWYEVSEFLCGRIENAYMSDSESEAAMIDIAELVMRVRRGV